MKNDKDFNNSRRTTTYTDINKSTRDQSLEKTNDVLFNQINDIILNKNLVKVTKKSKKKKLSNKALCLRPKLYLEEYDDINMEKWFRNRIKITNDEKNPKRHIYKLYLDDKKKCCPSLLKAEKESGIYVIRNNDGILAKIRWNIFSNHFKIFDDKNNLIEEIIYNFNFKGWNGPTKLQILIPKVPSQKNTWSKNKNKTVLYKMGNKMPEYNEFFKFYVLKFLRRKVIPNEKNIQVIYSDYKEESNNILLQFAQSNNNEFILDYKYPFNNITAFALGLTALSSRTFCK